MNMTGQPCLVLGDDTLVEGTIAALSGHVMNPDQRAKNGFDWNDFFIDIGAKSKAEVLAQGIQVGAQVIWNPETRKVGHYITGKAMDDRAGLAIIDRIVRKGKPEEYNYDLWVLSTVQEEIGLIGASSYGKDDFDLAISLEVGLSGDIPLVDKRDMPCVLGGGPIIVHKDYGVAYDRVVIKRVETAAREAGVELQHGVFSNFGTDGIALTGQGVPTSVVAFPARYTHSPFETIDEEDLEGIYKVMGQMLKMGE